MRILVDRCIIQSLDDYSTHRGVNIISLHQLLLLQRLMTDVKIEKKAVQSFMESLMHWRNANDDGVNGIRRDTIK